ASVAGIVLDWLGRRLVLHLSCRSLCTVRTQAGLSLPEGYYRRTAAIQDTCPVQDGAAPALPRVHHWVLEHTTDDGRPFVLRSGNHCVYHCGHPIRRTGSNQVLRRHISRVSPASLDACTFAEKEIDPDWYRSPTVIMYRPRSGSLAGRLLLIKGRDSERMKLPAHAVDVGEGTRMGVGAVRQQNEYAVAMGI